MYLTYDEYTDMGGTVDETAFENLEFEARAQIDYWTFNRLVEEETISDAVKRCMYKLISLLHTQQNMLDSSAPADQDGTVTAQIIGRSNDGVSVSYNAISANRIVDILQNSIKTTINQYLGNVRNSLGQKVLYRGIYPNE